MLMRQTRTRGVAAMQTRVPAVTTERRIQRYRQIVNHFEHVARTNMGNLSHVADVSCIAGINPRTLSRAFREVRGIGPYRYLRHLRLSEVRRVLSTEGGTVTQAAMRFGFLQLGSFGILYRKAFGETPSKTRKRQQSVQRVSPQDAPLEHELDRTRALWLAANAVLPPAHCEGG
jgi:transcriptional regulator GlxA family with amidase domain